MNIRLISGEFGGRLLDAPSGRRMHPMGERIRNALFNSIGSEVKGARVLDAFAGTGAVGLEALSRGAEHVTFVERDKLLQKILAGNIERLGVEDRTTLIRTSVSNWLSTSEPQLFDLILADPPYHDTQFSTVSRLFELLKPSALMVLSHPGKGEVLSQNGVVVVDNRSYGNADLTFYRRGDA
jgi:16S rRNA (guanine966-N2)-methyltransferase